MGQDLAYCTHAHVCTMAEHQPVSSPSPPPTLAPLLPVNLSIVQEDSPTTDSPAPAVALTVLATVPAPTLTVLTTTTVHARSSPDSPNSLAASPETVRPMVCSTLNIVAALLGVNICCTLHDVRPAVSLHHPATVFLLM